MTTNESKAIEPIMRQIEELRGNASKTVIQSYVHRGDKCFFVSTIDRESSAMLCPGRYNETIVWEFDLETKQRGGILYQDGAALGNINHHHLICEQLFNNGCIKEEE